MSPAPLSHSLLRLSIVLNLIFSRPIVSQKVKRMYVTESMAFYSINIFGYKKKRYALTIKCLFSSIGGEKLYSFQLCVM